MKKPDNPRGIGRKDLRERIKKKVGLECPEVESAPLQEPTSYGNIGRKEKRGRIKKGVGLEWPKVETAPLQERISYRNMPVDGILGKKEAHRASKPNKEGISVTSEQPSFPSNVARQASPLTYPTNVSETHGSIDVPPAESVTRGNRPPTRNQGPNEDSPVAVVPRAYLVPELSEPELVQGVPMQSTDEDKHDLEEGSKSGCKLDVVCFKISCNTKSLLAFFAIFVVMVLAAAVVGGMVGTGAFNANNKDDEEKERPKTPSPTALPEIPSDMPTHPPTPQNDTIEDKESPKTKPPTTPPGILADTPTHPPTPKDDYVHCFLNEEPRTTSLTANDGSETDNFGLRVALQNGTLAVGALGYDITGADRAGAAYVFAHDGSTWEQMATLTARDAAQGDRFGTSVALDGGTIVVGADYLSSFYDFDADWCDQTKGGSAYVFVRSGSAWTQLAKLVGSADNANDQFGYSVAVHENIIVVGAPNADRPKGTAYIFTQNGAEWKQSVRLKAPERAGRFGHSVAVQNGVVVVGAVNDDEKGANSGAAYVYSHSTDSTWELMAKLAANDGEEYDELGKDVAIDGEDIVVGATGDHSSTGAVYIFHRTGSDWKQAYKLTTSDGDTLDQFGTSVAKQGDVIIAGTEILNSAYIFVRLETEWTEQRKFVLDAASTKYLSPKYHRDVDIDLDTVVVGLPWFDTPRGEGSGSIFVYDFCYEQ